MLRPTLPDDTPALLAMTQETRMFRPLEIQALEEVLDDYHDGNDSLGHRSMTAESDRSIAGFVYYAPASLTDRSWYLYWIVVRPGLQARGLGSEMLRFVEREIQTMEGRVLFIETSSMPHYDLTRRFYLKHGYEQAAILADFYADGDDMVVFRKRLQ